MTQRTDYYILTPTGKVRLPGAADDRAAEALAVAFARQHLQGNKARVIKRVTDTIDVDVPGNKGGNNPNG